MTTIPSDHTKFTSEISSQIEPQEIFQNEFYSYQEPKDLAKDLFTSSEYIILQENNEQKFSELPKKNSITIKKSSIPKYLHSSQYYLSLNQDEDSLITIDSNKMKDNDSVRSLQDFILMYETISFFDLPYPFSAKNYFQNNSKEIFDNYFPNYENPRVRDMFLQFINLRIKSEENFIYTFKLLKLYNVSSLDYSSSYREYGLDNKRKFLRKYPYLNKPVEVEKECICERSCGCCGNIKPSKKVVLPEKVYTASEKIDIQLLCRELYYSEDWYLKLNINATRFGKEGKNFIMMLDYDVKIGIGEVETFTFRIRSNEYSSLKCLKLNWNYFLDQLSYTKKQLKAKYLKTIDINLLNDLLPLMISSVSTNVEQKIQMMIPEIDSEFGEMRGVYNTIILTDFNRKGIYDSIKEFNDKLFSSYEKRIKDYEENGGK